MKNDFKSNTFAQQLLNEIFKRFIRERKTILIDKVCGLHGELEALKVLTICGLIGERNNKYYFNERHAQQYFIEML